MNTESERSLARELVVVLVSAIAVALPFVNGALAGTPAPNGSLDLRYVLVLSGAVLGLLAIATWRVSESPRSAHRTRAALVLLALVPLIAAISAPRDAFWVSILTIELLTLAPITVFAALWRFARSKNPRSRERMGLAAMLALALMAPWATLSWGLLSVQLAIAPVRLAHQSPLLHEGEEEVEFPARDGTMIRGTYTPGRRGAGGVLVLHGISDGRTRMAGWSNMLGERGYHALRIDWRGHGRSEGSIVTFADRERQDLDAAFDWLRARPGVDGSKMAIVATSMGAGIALSSTQTLVPRGLHGIVAFAPPSDYAALIERRISGLGSLAPFARLCIEFVSHGLGQISPLDLKPGRELEAGPPVPVLLFHGDQDATIALEQSQKLYTRVPSVELHVLEGVTHDEIPAAVLSDAGARRRILRFLRLPRTHRDAPDDETEPEID